ncbi:MAG TPA: NAD(P)H-dependent oxidoreductase [Burkholderiaceae bacterium]|nr:NAD(P)H-dependent oxidoreductase [Burkholderiaceae bacterium]
MRPRLAIVWWSTTGGTRQLAEAAAAGAADEPGVTVALRHCDDAGPEDLLQAAGTIFATPEHLASMAGPMKHFFDRCYYPVLDRIAGRPYALIVCAGSDGQGTIRQVERIATGWRLRRIAEPLLVITHAQTPQQILAPKTIGEADLQRAREFGAAMAAGLALGIW